MIFFLENPYISDIQHFTHPCFSNHFSLTISLLKIFNQIIFFFKKIFKKNYFDYICYRNNRRCNESNPYKLSYLRYRSLLSFACKKDRAKDQIMQVVAEWTGREIQFPEGIPCLFLGRD